MTQEQRRLYLIQELLKERPDGAGIEIPTEREGQKRLLRSLFNLRQTQPASQEFLAVQDAYLQEETRRKGVTSLAQLRPVEKGLYLAGGHHHLGLRGHCQRGKLPAAGVLLSLPRVH